MSTITVYLALSLIYSCRFYCTILVDTAAYGGCCGSNAPDVVVIFNHQFFVMGILPTENFLIYHLRMGTRLKVTHLHPNMQFPTPKPSTTCLASVGRILVLGPVCRSSSCVLHLFSVYVCPLLSDRSGCWMVAAENSIVENRIMTARPALPPSDIP